MLGEKKEKKKRGKGEPVILVERLSQVTNSSVFDDFVKIRKYLRGRGGGGDTKKGETQ